MKRGLQQLLEDDDTDSDEENFVFLLLLNAAQTGERGERWRHEDRVIWENEVARCRTQQKGFQQRYHMSEGSFNKLVDLLRPMIAIDQRQSMRSTQGAYPITPRVCDTLVEAPYI